MRFSRHFDMTSGLVPKTRCQNCIPASTIRSDPIKEEMIAVSTRYRPVEETFLHQKKVGAWEPVRSTLIVLKRDSILRSKSFHPAVKIANGAS